MLVCVFGCARGEVLALIPATVSDIPASILSLPVMLSSPTCETHFHSVLLSLLFSPALIHPSHSDSVAHLSSSGLKRWISV